MRVFAAIPLDSATVQRLGKLKGQLDVPGIDIAWVKPENIHLTLVFLGELTDADCKQAGQALAAVAAAHQPFSVQFDSIGAFPGERFPRIIWAGIRTGAEQMIALGESVRAALAGVGEEEDKAFMPHATIGRVRSTQKTGELREKLVQAQASWEATPLEKITSVRLYESQLGRSGPTYRVAGGWLLGAPSK